MLNLDMRKYGWAILIFGLFLSAGCTPTEEPPRNEATIPASGDGVVEPTPTEIIPAHEASGLVFSNAEGTWWINWEGELELLTAYGQAQVSPDGDWLAYSAEGSGSYLGDIWLEAIAGEERVNLTNTPDTDESMPFWLESRPQSVLFGSGPDVGLANPLYPTIVNLDGSGYEVLDRAEGGLRAVAPGGEWFFYGGYDAVLQTYSWDTGIGRFDPVEYGLDMVEKLYQPEWSPDGRYVAFFVSGVFDSLQGTGLAIAVFDLEAQTAQLLHPYAPAGGAMFQNELAWSPDGEWLAFTTYAEAPASGRAPNAWVIRPDGADEDYIGVGSALVWRYDSMLLAFQSMNAEQTEDVYLVERENWTAQRIEGLFPERILFLQDWLHPGR